MGDELKESVQDMIHYYNQHTVEGLAKTNLGFVVDDFTRLLSELDKQLNTVRG